MDYKGAEGTAGYSAFRSREKDWRYPEREKGEEGIFRRPEGCGGLFADLFALCPEACTAAGKNVSNKQNWEKLCALHVFGYVVLAVFACLYKSDGRFPEKADGAGKAAGGMGTGTEGKS